MGFQYELSEQFAKSLGLKLRIEVANSVDEMIQKLLAGEGDMIAIICQSPKSGKTVFFIVAKM